MVQEMRAADLYKVPGVSETIDWVNALVALDRDTLDAEAIEDTQRTTRRFARRQDTWFRRDERIVWIPYDAPDLVERALAVFAERATAARG